MKPVIFIHTIALVLTESTEAMLAVSVDSVVGTPHWETGRADRPHPLQLLVYATRSIPRQLYQKPWPVLLHPASLPLL